MAIRKSHLGGHAYKASRMGGVRDFVFAGNKGKAPRLKRGAEYEHVSIDTGGFNPPMRFSR